MAYVPGFRNDVFVSYAHGDDDPPLTPDGKGWVEHFRDHLESAVRHRLGSAPSVFFDKRQLRPDLDFDKEIHDQLDTAALILVASPSYGTSWYCRKEREYFLKKTAAKHAERFRMEDLANANFIFKVISLEDDELSHRNILPDLRLSDIPFCEGGGGYSRTFSIDENEFAKAIDELGYKVAKLLKSMRGKCPTVFLWPDAPKLANELTDASYRVLPEAALNPEGEMEAAKLAVFLLGSEVDDETGKLLQSAAIHGQQRVIWRGSGAATLADDLLQGAELLDANCQLFDEVLAMLRRPEAQAANGKRVYVIYNPKDAEEKENAAYVIRTIRREFEVDEPREFSAHRRKLGACDGVVLVWGKSDRDWYVHNFDDMSNAATRARSQGICFFDPREPKSDTLNKLRGFSELYLIEQFGAFDPQKLDPFLQPLRGNA
jgi:TIR domain